MDTSINSDRPSSSSSAAFLSNSSSTTTASVADGHSKSNIRRRGVSVKYSFHMEIKGSLEEAVQEVKVKFPILTADGRVTVSAKTNLRTQAFRCLFYHKKNYASCLKRAQLKEVRKSSSNESDFVLLLSENQHEHLCLNESPGKLTKKLHDAARVKIDEYYNEMEMPPMKIQDKLKKDGIADLSLKQIQNRIYNTKHREAKKAKQARKSPSTRAISTAARRMSSMTAAELETWVNERTNVPDYEHDVFVVDYYVDMLAKINATYQVSCPFLSNLMLSYSFNRFL